MYLPNTLSSTEFVSWISLVKLILMPYSTSSPADTFDSTNEASRFERSPVHLIRSLYLAGAALVSGTPEDEITIRGWNVEDGVIPQLMRSSLSPSPILYFHWNVKLVPTIVFLGLVYFVRNLVKPSAEKKLTMTTSVLCR